MLIDRPEVTETSQIVNATVASGTANPANPDVGELFYRTDLGSLLVYTGTSWVEVGATSLSTHVADATVHLTPAQNTLLDGLAPTLTAAELNFVDGVTSPIQTQLNTAASNLSSHLADTTLHLTSAQNTLLDGLAPTLTAAELNFMDGVTSSVQGQLDSIVSVNNSQATAITNLQTQVSNNASSGSAALSAHEGNLSLHLTAAQNNFLDGLNLPTLTPTEVNRLIGVTSDVQTQFNTINANRLHRDGSIAMTGALNMGTNRITGLGEPTAASDAATRAYVDSLVQGLHWKAAVRVATTVAGGNITLSGLQTVDGVSLATNDRVLVKNQTNAAQNGIYLVSASAWSRAPDANTNVELDGAAVFVREGTVHADSAWVQVNTISVLDTSPVNFTQFAAAGGLAEGSGIQITGAVVSVRAGNGLTFSGNNLTLNTSTDFNVSTTQLALAATPSAPAGTYGSGTDIPIITTDGRGRITGVSSASLTGSFQPANPNLTNLSALSTIGMVARTSSNTFVTRTLAVSGGGLSISNANGDAGNPTITSNATSLNTASTLVQRDGSGSFSAGTITASLSGAASLNVLRAGDTMTGGLGVSFGGGSANSNQYLGVSNGSEFGIHLTPRAIGGSWNPYVQSQDNVIIFKGGSAGAATALTIAPWSASSVGLRITHTGQITTPAGFNLSGSTAPSILNAWFSTPPYGISQGDNQTHFGYNDNGTFRNFIRGATTTVDSTLVSSGLFSALAGIESSSTIGIYNPNPVLILQDTNGSGAAQTGYISLRDNSAVERAWIGYGSASNTDLSISNNQGDVNVVFSGTSRFRFNSSGQLTISGTTNTAIIDGSPTAFGAIRVLGSTGGYNGVQFGGNPGLTTLMVRNSDNLAGMYQAATSTWQWYWDPAQQNLRISNNGHLAWHTGNMASPSVSATGGTVAQRDGSGYLYATYLNQSSPNNENGAVSQIMVTNGSDNFLRKATPAHVTASLTGTASINITGSAGNSASLGGIAAADYFRYEGFTLDANTMPTRRDGFTYAVNAPFVGPIMEVGASEYMMQFNAPYSGGGLSLAFRTRNGDSATNNAWRRVLTDADFTNWAPSLTGAGASGSWNINAYPRRWDGTPITFFWAGQSGQPTWLWGSNDGVNMYVWNPSNFVVANTNSISSATGGSYTWTNTNFFRSNGNTAAITSAPLQAFSDNGGGAIMAFHRGGSYAINMGLDSDNVFRIGGWSAAPGRLQMDMSGNLTMAGDVTAFSDRRLKTDIKKIEGALDKVERLNGVTYTRVDSGLAGLGLIAQEVQEVVPSVVKETADGTLSVAYGNLVGLLVEAIKELKAEIAELKKTRS